MKFTLFSYFGLKTVKHDEFLCNKKMKNYFNKNIEILLNDECLNNNNYNNNNVMQQQTKSDNKIDEDESINYY